MKNNFLDRVTLFLRSGNGGNGAATFRREKFVRRGGPDGGDGGKGGDIIFRVNKTLFTLNHFRNTHHFTAENGEKGMSKQMSGKSGADIIIEVPPGTVVIDENNLEILDLIEGDYVFLKGGEGGKGNVHYKSSTNRSPRKYTYGKEGIAEKVLLELRIIADVGLVGKPNAGKSTFLSKITNANPNIANYPFTTLVPNLGILSDGVNTIRIADIPGIIEGASIGKGLGIRFLKHISRVKVLLFIIDISDKDPIGTYETLIKELNSFNKKLLRKKRIILFNKIDKVDESKIEEIKRSSIKEQFVFASLINDQIGDIDKLLMEMIYG